LNSGETVTIDSDNLTVNGSRIIAPFDIEASNGIIHTIEDVLMPAPMNPSIVDAATDAGLTTLLAAVNEANIANTLLMADEITVFAPSNEAFADALMAFGADDLNGLVIKLGGVDKLTQVLQFHVVPAVAFSGDLADGDQTFTTLSGEDITVNKTGSTVTVTDAGGNTSTVTTADVAIANGVVHVIDGVLLPTIENPNIVDAATSAGLTTLLEAVTTAELATTLTDAEAITVFAPTNTAFGLALDAYGVSSLSELVAELGGVENLAKVLQFHVVPATAFSIDLAEGDQTFNTLAGEEITVNRTGDAVTVTDAGGNTFNVMMADVAIANGVVHVINGVLLPTIELPDVVEAATSAGLTTLIDAVTAAELADDLTGAEAITVFAPTNDAFGKLLERFEVASLTALIEKLGAETVANVLKFHVVPAQAFSHDLADGEQEFTTLEGQTLTVTKADGAVTVTDYLGFTYTVNPADVAIENGVVHVIDGVVLPDVSDDPNVVEAATTAGLTTLIDAVVAAELNDDLVQATAITVFAPTNDAFAALLQAQEVTDLQGLIDKLGAANVAKVLQYHVVPAVAFSEDLMEGDQSLTTLAGETLTVNKTGGTVTVTDTNNTTYTVTTADVTIENGVVHVINGVVLPTLEL
ncbi:MAG: fasciclin domain-containing protein, partial [Bacteroidota bacterium]